MQFHALETVGQIDACKLQLNNRLLYSHCTLGYRLECLGLVFMLGGKINLQCRLKIKFSHKMRHNERVQLA